MSSAWDYEANACSKDGKFSAKFEGCEVVMGAPTLGELRLFINGEALSKFKKRALKPRKKTIKFGSKFS